MKVSKSFQRKILVQTNLFLRKRSRKSAVKHNWELISSHILDVPIYLGVDEVICIRQAWST